MTISVLNVIAAMAEVATVEPSKAEGNHPRKPVITVSRDWGAGGDVIATRLAQRLGLPLYDDNLIDEVAERLHADPSMIAILDKSFERAKDMWLYRLLSGTDISPDTFRSTLIKVVGSLGRMGGVIIGRGAHVVLRDACALRVRIAGSPEVCARRMAAQGHGAEADLLATAREENHRRGSFVWEAFHSRLSDASQFDITINTDRMVDFEDVVEMLVGMSEAVQSGRVLGELGAP